MNQSVEGGVGLKYCLYARKSSEDDERQALSIDSQIKEMEAVAVREGLEVVDTRKESHSAKDSGERPIFEQMLQDIRRGRGFNAILTWDPSRISRNGGDLGQVIDLMDQGLLEEIRTPGQTFRNSPNEKFLLMILCSQAKLENDNRSVNVKRGLKNKVEMGWRPGAAPLGYLNDRNKQNIVLDPDRAPTIQEMFRKVAENGFTGRAIQAWLADEVNFRTRTNKKVVLSAIYVMLKNPFYYGKFEYPVGSGKWYDGAHEPLITKELFDEVQTQLAAGARQAYGRQDFGFIKLMKCGKCGSGITAEEKFKKLLNGGVRRYVYYHCTAGKDRNCQYKSIREEALIEQFLKILDILNLDQIGMKDKLEDEIDRFYRFTVNVLKMKPEEMKIPKVDLRKYAKYMLEEGSPEEQREILSCIKHEVVLTDGQVSLM